MYIRQTTRRHKGKTYTNHLLVESVHTPHGPRQRTICSLGNLEPAPPDAWLALAHKLESSLQGQKGPSQSSCSSAHGTFDGRQGAFNLPGPRHRAS